MPLIQEGLRAPVAALWRLIMLRSRELIGVRSVRLFAKKALVVLVIAIGFLGSLMLMASPSNAQDARSAASMVALKDKTAKLGVPRIEGQEEVGAKSAPALYFGSTKMNNNSTIVDEVGKEDPGMTATLFVKAGEEYIRVATSVPLPDGRRAVGTILKPPALDSIKAGKPSHGEVQVLGTVYIADYEPIKDASGETIGAYFVGYKK
jgi:Cache 3/Cache 2 fusion domain